jgi:hypothetical protein
MSDDLVLIATCPIRTEWRFRWVSPKVSGLTQKSRSKWKMLRGIYSAIYGEVNVSVCVEIKRDCIEK